MGILHQNKNKKIVEYAKKILAEYTKHPLYSEPFEFLWTKVNYETSKNETFIGPFLTQNEYVNDIKDGIAHMDISDELRALYLNKWIPPPMLNNGVKEFVFASNIHVTTHESVLQNFKDLFSKKRFKHSILFRVATDWWLGIIIGFLIGIAYVVR